jgi:hypothetical protein
VVAGDFDHDGDTDYIAGNLGLNTKYRASAEEPVRVHAADFDQNGSIDPVLSRYVQGESYPVASRDLMIDQMSGMQRRFPRYAAYAGATLEQTLSAEERAQASVATAVTFASAFIENEGGGTFALRPLPLPAQVAPTFGMLTGDLDADSNLDVVMAGNWYARDTHSGRDDASIGGVLLGDGKGGFRYLSGIETGFFVEGDARAVAEVVLDHSQSLVLVTQNDDSLRVFSPVRAGDARYVRLQPLDAYALVTRADGTTQKEEFYYGSTYLSQSSRYLKVRGDILKVVLYDSRGRSRTLPSSVAQNAAGRLRGPPPKGSGQ